jgi:hypothetical protein
MKVAFSSTQYRAKLLLLPLLVVLLFGNCGVGRGVRGLLTDMTPTRRQLFRAVVAKRQAERATARQQLHGSARQDAYQRIEHATNARFDSLGLSQTEGRKLLNRRNKLEHQLLGLPSPKPQP